MHKEKEIFNAATNIHFLNRNFKILDEGLECIDSGLTATSNYYFFKSGHERSARTRIDRVRIR